MFRRIELINHYRDRETSEYVYYKHGLLGISLSPVVDAWIESLRGPGKRSLPANCRFWFTERGWREVGREVVAACGRSGQQYRVLRIKENEVDVIWRDRLSGLEVAAQPRQVKRKPGNI